MPLNNDTGEYEVTTAEQIDAYLRDVSKQDEYFGPDHDLTPNSVYSSLYATIAEAQEFVDEDIKDVYESAFLDTATGADLDKVVAITGVQRRAAQRATGYVTFSGQGPVTNSYTIPQGLRVTTESGDVEYRTRESRQFAPIETFESNLDDYTNSADFSLQTTTVFEGSSALQADTPSTLYTDGENIRRGDTVHFYQYGVDGGVQFCLQNADNYYEVSVTTNDMTIEVVADGVTELSVTETPTVPTATWLEYVIDLTPRGFEVQLRNAETDTVLAQRYVEETQFFAGAYGFTAAVSGVIWDTVTYSAVSEVVEAVVGGIDGNTAPNTVTVLPSPPNGVTSVTNPDAIGNPDITNITRSPQKRGQNEETDAALRSRVKSTLTQGGSATTNALISALINEVDGVTSVSIFENNTNSTVNGLPPYSFECVVLGGADLSIARTIFDTKAVTAQDVGGVNGTDVTASITAENGQSYDISFSRPQPVTIEIDATLSITDEYVGDDEIADEIVQYIGGQTSGGNDIVGLGVSDDVYINELENILVGVDEVGVVGIDEANTTYSPTPTTNGNNVPIISIAENEVATTTASDITITTV